MEQADAISGVLLIEDCALGWNASSVISDYLHEEGVKAMISMDMMKRTNSFDSQCNQALCLMESIRHSSLVSCSTSSPVMTACCLDSALAVLACIVCLIYSCRQMNHRRLTMRQLINQYSLGGKRCILNLSYSTEIIPNPPVDPKESYIGNQEPLFSWKKLYESSHSSVPATSCKIVTYRSIFDSRVLFPEFITIIWIELCIPVIQSSFQIRSTQIYILFSVYWILLHSRIVSDPLLLPLSSIDILRQEQASISQSLQWYDKTTNSFSPQQTKMTVGMSGVGKE